MKNIAVIGGGYSKEKGISLKSAKTVFENIDRNKYNVYKIQIDTDGWFGFDKSDNKQLINRTDFSFEILFLFFCHYSASSLTSSLVSLGLSDLVTSAEETGLEAA